MKLSPAVRTQLKFLAERHGVLGSYLNASGDRRETSPAAFSAVLRALGVAAGTPTEIHQSLQESVLRPWQTPLEPVLVSWKGSGGCARVRLSAGAWARPFRAQLRLESGEVRDWTSRLKRSAVVQREVLDGKSLEARELTLPSSLPTGYHILDFEQGSNRCEAMIVVAPDKAYTPHPARREWGVFLPAYALHSRSSWGAGDWGDLERLGSWTADLGGTVVGTLPMLASFMEEDPSPYAPASRLFWNEFYVDVGEAPELKQCGEARRLLRDRSFQDRVDHLRRAELVEYREQMQLKRQVLQKLARWFFTNGSPARRRSFERFQETYPLATSYARFRAIAEQRNTSWREWPQRLRDGKWRGSDFSQGVYRYHLYAQWLAHEQMSKLAERLERRDVRLYLDMPLGVRADGFDAWRERDLFAFEASGGAPPDPVFTQGQDWGFPPMHPGRLREQHYRYVLEYLRHHLRCGKMLRLDHAMSLHRLYWVPKGGTAADGAYVRYALDEWCAILCLESHRHRAVLVGENLGTVPPEVNEAMAEHRLRELFVVQYEQQPKPSQALRVIPRFSVASLNTHDMPPFTAHNRAMDIADRAELGLLSKRTAGLESIRRTRLQRALTSYLRFKGLLDGKVDERLLMEAVLSHLAGSEGETVLINLEDLWLETDPQNVPGTFQERVNWRRKTRWSLERITQSSSIRALLTHLNQRRRAADWVVAREAAASPPGTRQPK